MSSTTPLGAVGRGLAAGVVGTAAMTGVQTAVAKARDQEDSTTPAEVAKRIIRGVLQREVPEERTALLNNVMHWTYGTSWGAVYGLVQGTMQASAFKHGALFGVGVWSTSLVQLPAMQLAPPVWEYPRAELALEVGYHVVYGLGVAAAYAALNR